MRVHAEEFGRRSLFYCILHFFMFNTHLAAHNMYFCQADFSICALCISGVPACPRLHHLKMNHGTMSYLPDLTYIYANKNRKSGFFLIP